jgi:glycosyltransferase involved in cell wall biosynthesis
LARICFLLNNDFTHDARVRREAESLVSAGHEVHLYAVRPRGKGGVPIEEQQGGLFIHRIIRKSLYRYHAFSLRALKAFLKIRAGSGRFDVIHAHDANMLLVGWLIARTTGAKLIYDAHEYWEAIFSEERKRIHAEADRLKPAIMTRRLKRLDTFGRFETWVLPRCRAVISVNESLCRMLQERANGRIPDCVPIRNISTALAEDAAPQRKFHALYGLSPQTRVILYQGMISEKRGLSRLVDALEQVQRPDVALVMMGHVQGEEDEAYHRRLMARIQDSPNLSGRVFFHEAVPQRELLSWTVGADLGIHPILNWGFNHYYCLPNKVFEYAQAGIPLAVSDFPEMRRIVDTYEIGFTFDPEDTAGLARRLEQYFSDEAAQARYRQNLVKAKAELTWENEEKRLLALYQAVLSGEPLSTEVFIDATPAEPARLPGG